MELSIPLVKNEFINCGFVSKMTNEIFDVIETNKVNVFKCNLVTERKDSVLYPKIADIIERRLDDVIHKLKIEKALNYYFQDDELYSASEKFFYSEHTN